MNNLLVIGMGAILLCCLFQCCLFGSICCPPKPPPPPSQSPVTPVSPRISHGRPTSHGSSYTPSYTPPTYYYYRCENCRCVRRSSSSPRADQCNPNNSLSCCTSSSCCQYSYCCSSSYCLLRITDSNFKAYPDRLFVSQAFNLTWNVSSPSSCGSVSCQGSCSYLGHNCSNGQVLPNELGICPPSSNTQSLCDPNNQFNKTLSLSGSLSITPNPDYWGLHQYTLTCTRSDGIRDTKTIDVFTVPVLYYQEGQPFSLILKPFISLIEGLNK